MVLIDLIRISDFDSVWGELKNAYGIQDEVKILYKNAFDALREMQIETQTNEDEDYIIAVCELEDVLEPDSFVFDVFGISKSDSKRYSLGLEPWRTWIASEVLDKSLELYGGTIVIAHILYEMTFYGYSELDTEESQNEILERLDEAEKSIQDGRNEFVPLEEVYSALGLETHNETGSEVEKRDSKSIREAMERNEFRINELLSDWRGCH